MFNPIKGVFNIFMMTLTLLVLGYTHSQAFKLGLGISSNPVARTGAEVIGLVPPQPQASCPAVSEANQPPWWQKFIDPSKDR